MKKIKGDSLLRFDTFLVVVAGLSLLFGSVFGMTGTVITAMFSIFFFVILRVVAKTSFPSAEGGTTTWHLGGEFLEAIDDLLGDSQAHVSHPKGANMTKKRDRGDQKEVI